MVEHLGKAGELWDKSYDYIKQNPKKGVLLLILIAILIIIGSFLASIGTNLALFFKSDKTDNGYRPPSLELTYNKDSEKLNEKGLYETDFSIYIHQPIGNFETGFKIGDKINNAECLSPEWKESGTETTNGVLASSTYKYEVKCTSYQQILDTKNLFFLLKK